MHRRHHAKCETPDDPHSPKILGLRKVLTEGAELYGEATDDPQIVARYSHGTPDDWVERHVYGRFTWQGVGLMLILDVLLFGVYGITLWAVQMLWIPFFAAGVINGVGHFWGYRNFESSRCLDQHRALGHPDRGRGAAQQSPRLPELRQAVLKVVGAGCRLVLYPAADALGWPE